MIMYKPKASSTCISKASEWINGAHNKWRRNLIVMNIGIHDGWAYPVLGNNYCREKGSKIRATILTMELDNWSLLRFRTKWWGKTDRAFLVSSIRTSPVGQAIFKIQHHRIVAVSLSQSVSIVDWPQEPWWDCRNGVRTHLVKTV